MMWKNVVATAGAPIAGLAFVGALGVGTTLGISGAWTTSTLNTWSVSAPVPTFTQYLVDDLTGANATDPQVSTVDGAVTTQLQAAFGDLAPNEGLSQEFVKIENTNPDVNAIYTVRFAAPVVRDAAGNTVSVNATEYNDVLANYSVQILGISNGSALQTYADTLAGAVATGPRSVNTQAGAPVSLAPGEDLVLAFSGVTSNSIPSAYAGWTIESSVIIQASKA